VKNVVIGLMSGTSLDGISAAAARFKNAGEGGVDVELLSFISQPYNAAQRARLAASMTGSTPAEYCRLNFDLGEWLSEAAAAVIEKSGVQKSDILAVASHGQTVWHEAGHSTWQWGESAVIAERIGVDVVSDFRVRDVAAGGQGAPLVPIADALLFSSKTEWRGLQNLGGIGNVTIVPPGGALAEVSAFDTGPGVAVIDGVTRLLHPELPYDVDGKLAAAGEADEEIVRELLSDPYFSAPPPKSTGRELFSASYIATLIERCRARSATDEDIIATAVALTSASIADAYRRFVKKPISEVLLSGGGAKNPALYAAIEKAIAPIKLRKFDDIYFDGEAKEAVAFALLGYLFMQRRTANVPAATGAKGPRILGKLTPA
jgi:anhydro-N-acetylmuramic acid kinase